MIDFEVCYIGIEFWKFKEVLEENGVIIDKVDIFVFGFTLWEMMILFILYINFLDDDDDDEGIIT